MDKQTETNYFQISFFKAMGILATAILITMVGTAFSILSIANSDHFTLVSAIEDINILQDTTVKKEVYEIQQRQIIEKLDILEDIIKEISK